METAILMSFRIKLEVAELNGRSPDMPDLIPAYFIAPGIRPGFWVFAPKTPRHGNQESGRGLEANPPTASSFAGDFVLSKETLCR